MKYKVNSRYFKTILTVTFSFILGCMVTINLAPINKTCTLQNIDREYNIMQNSKLKSPNLIILILSAPKNFDKRTTIRQTWLKLYRHDHEKHDHEQFKVKHYFVIGSLGLNNVETAQIDSEQSRYKDILLVPMYDYYGNLTEKIKKSVEWLDGQIDYGVEFKYILKCDDDSFVVLNNLVTELIKIEDLYLKSNYQNALELIGQHNDNFQTLNVQVNNKLGSKNNLSLYWGYFSGTARIKTRGKWKEKEWIASDRYVPYALGGGYILSKDLIRFISKNSNNLRSFTSEDTSVGFWLAPVNNVLRVHDIRFDTEWTSRGCRNFYLITHNIPVNDMKIMFKNYLTNRNLCSKENVKREHYLYNWKVLPSQCCKAIQEYIVN